MQPVKLCAKKDSVRSGKERWHVYSVLRRNSVSHWSHTSCCSVCSTSISVAPDQRVRMWNMHQHWTAKRWNWIPIILVAIGPPFHCSTASKRSSDSAYHDSHRPFNWSPARDYNKFRNLFISTPHNQPHRTYTRAVTTNHTKQWSKHTHTHTHSYDSHLHMFVRVLFFFVWYIAL